MGKEAIIFTICIVLLIIGMVLTGIIVSANSTRECGERGLENTCTYNDRLCADSCSILNLEFFRWNSGGFGSDECWCIQDGESKQVW